MITKSQAWGSLEQRAKIRTVIYTRVSSDAHGGTSVSEQEHYCRGYVSSQSWRLLRVYSDNDKSASEGSRDVREDWELLLAALDRGEFDLIVVWEPSRATRDEEMWLRVARACIEHGVMFCANGTVYDPADPDDYFQLSLFFALARREQAMTRRRVKRTVDSQAVEGKPGPGKAPFGYRRVYEVVGQKRLVEKQVPDYEERTFTSKDGVHVNWSPAAIVKAIFERVAEGVPPYQIAIVLNLMGIPNPRTIHAFENNTKKKGTYSAEWNPRVIRNLVKNEAYLGSRLHHGQVTKTERWDALATPKQFANIKLLYAQRKRSKKRAGAQRHLISGILTCGVCGQKSTASTSLGTPVYRCTRGHALIAIQQADDIVKIWILNWLSREENLAELRMFSGVSDEYTEAQIELTRLKTELEEWESLAGKGVTPTAFKNFYTAHEPKLKAAEERVALLGVPVALQQLVASDEPLHAWREMSISGRRDAIEYLVDLRLERVGRGRRVPIDQRLIISRKPLRPTG